MRHDGTGKKYKKVGVKHLELRPAVYLKASCGLPGSTRVWMFQEIVMRGRVPAYGVTRCTHSLGNSIMVPSCSVGTSNCVMRPSSIWQQALIRGSAKQNFPPVLFERSWSPGSSTYSTLATDR